MSLTLIQNVRKSLRVMTDAYDSEIQIYIHTVLYDLDRLNIMYNGKYDKENILDSEEVEPEIATLIVTYVKANFGNSQEEYKNAMLRVYDKLLRNIIVDKSHKNPSTTYSTNSEV